MMLNAFYTCPAGYRVAVTQDALNDVPEKRTVAERSVFGWCDECEICDGEGVCELRLVKISQ
jgi:hypothetical protein